MNLLPRTPHYEFKVLAEVIYGAFTAALVGGVMIFAEQVQDSEAIVYGVPVAFIGRVLLAWLSNQLPDR